MPKPLKAGTTVTIMPKFSEAYQVEVIEYTYTTFFDDIRYLGTVSRETMIALGKHDPGMHGHNINFYHSDIVDQAE